MDPIFTGMNALLTLPSEKSAKKGENLALANPHSLTDVLHESLFLS
jgi:hypothetical protein